MSDKKQFSISRINTNKGIFRLQGSVVSTNSEISLSYDKAEFMGTDGWQELDLHSRHAIVVLSEIKNVVLAHIKGQF